jgi:hypothetical protein
MAKVYSFTSPVDVNKSEMLDYYVNIFGPDKEFIIAYRYKGYSGNAFMDSIKDLRIQYPKSKGYSIQH